MDQDKGAMLQGLREHENIMLEAKREVTIELVKKARQDLAVMRIDEDEGANRLIATLNQAESTQTFYYAVEAGAIIPLEVESFVYEQVELQETIDITFLYDPWVDVNKLTKLIKVLQFRGVTSFVQTFRLKRLTAECFFESSEAPLGTLTLSYDTEASGVEEVADASPAVIAVSRV